MEKADASDVWHAVTVVGMKLTSVDEPCHVKSNDLVLGDDHSGNLKAVYVQDDRIGPYRRAEVFCNQGQLRVRIKVQSHDPKGETEEWIVKYVLIPLHPKIRINFNDLRSITLKWLIPNTQGVVLSDLELDDLAKMSEVRFRYWIERGYRYVQRVLSEGLVFHESAIDFRKEFVLPRYVAVKSSLEPSHRFAGPSRAKRRNEPDSAWPRRARTGRADGNESTLKAEIERRWIHRKAGLEYSKYLPKNRLSAAMDQASAFGADLAFLPFSESKALVH